jgi:hypothetical protein
MLFVGLLLPIPVGYFLIGKRRASVPLTLFGLISLPLLVWGASIGVGIGPCSVPSCISHTQHSHLVITVVALVILVVAFVLLGLRYFWPGGVVLVVAELVGAYSMTKVDTPITITLIILAGLAIAYLIYRYMEELPESRVPDYPPTA